MTDKQIIIDDIDVSGCRFYSEKLSTMKGTGSISVAKSNGFCTHNIRGLDDSSCYDAHIEYAKCKNNNCYYKQLKRKEQECESWKALINEAQIEQRKLEEQLEAYKMEAEEGKEINAELKAELKQEKAWHKSADEIGKVNSEYAAKLKQTLAEIKELLLKTPTNSQEHCINAKSVILQKINEVENA